MNHGKPKTTSQPLKTRQTKSFGRKLLFCDELGHRQAECWQRVRDVKKGTLRTREREQNADDRPQYNRKLVCQIRGYTGQSANYFNKRQKNCLPIPPDTIWKTNTRRNAKPETRNRGDIERNSRNQPAYGRLMVWWPTRVWIWVWW